MWVNEIWFSSYNLQFCIFFSDGYGRIVGDPKYFQWNNWGQPLKARSTSALEKLEGHRAPFIPEPQMMDVDIIPDVGNEIIITANRDISFKIGSEYLQVSYSTYSTCVLFLYKPKWLSDNRSGPDDND